MIGAEPLLAQFETQRERLRGVAFRILGSASEADDALQEAWLRLQTNSQNEIDNLGGWLTTVVSRIALDMLRARKRRQTQPLEEQDMVEPADTGSGVNPEEEALLAESIGIALLVVLDRLQPSERLAFVLHDLFGVSFGDIASILNRSPGAARQLASRARRRVQGFDDTATRRAKPQDRIVRAFFAASRKGDFQALLELLDPDAELMLDPALPALHGRKAPVVIQGATLVAKQAAVGATRASGARVMVIDGRAGIIVAPAGRLHIAMIFTLANERIARIELIADARRLEKLDLTLA